MAKKKSTQKDVQPVQEEKVTTKNKSVVDTVWNLFSSMKLGIALLAIVAVMTIIGTFYTTYQGEARFGAFFNAWYYKIFLSLLLLNLLVCSLNRFKQIVATIKGPKVQVSESTIKNLKVKATVKVNDNVEAAADKVQGALSKHGFRIFRAEGDGKIFFGSDRGRFGVFGPYMTHLSFIIIILALWMNYSPNFGYSGSVMAKAGTSFNSQTDIQVTKGTMGPIFNVQVKDFKALYRQSDRSLDSYQSDVTVIDENGKKVMDHLITMNHPLVYKGYYFYQSSYVYSVGGAVKGQTFENSMTMAPNPASDSQAYVNNMQIPGTDMSVSANVTTGNKIQYQVFKSGQQQPIKEGTADFLQKITIDKDTSLQFGNYTVLSVSKDPSKYVGAVGSALLIIGVFISFLIRNRRIWAIVAEKNGAVAVELGGLTNKNKSAFETEFNNVVEEITPKRGEKDGRK